MKTNLIIGAGQLGSRHLQGLLRISDKQAVYVLDPSEQSLQVAKDRAAEIQNDSDIHFITSWDQLPEAFDLVIVATAAGPRAKIVTQLLNNHKVKFLVLEKILFQDLESYGTIGELIRKTATPTWINHPRRMLQHYHDIKDIIAQSGEQVVFHTVGSNWGLACSALHFIDLCAMVSGSEVATTDMDWIDDVAHQSKRNECIEFTGSVKGKMKNGSVFVVSSLDGDLGEVTVYIATNSNRWIVQEGRSAKVIRLAAANAFKEEIMYFDTEFQSTITTRIAQQLFDKGDCTLPTYDEACASHIPFINASLQKYTAITGIETKNCPIT